MLNKYYTVGELRNLIANLPDDAPVFYQDPNFSGKHYTNPESYDFKIGSTDYFSEVLLINFPFESPID